MQDVSPLFSPSRSLYPSEIEDGNGRWVRAGRWAFCVFASFLLYCRVGWNTYRTYHGDCNAGSRSLGVLLSLAI